MVRPKGDNKRPVSEKKYLSLLEAVDYTGVGRDKLREISDREDCNFVFWAGNKRLLNREKLEEYLDRQFSL